MTSLRVAVIGAGAIGGTVARELASGAVPGARLVGVVVRRRESATEQGLTPVTLAEALDECDLLVECAGVEVVAEFGPAVIGAGRDFLVTSVGALVDGELRERLLAGPGRLFLTSGAIGGLDLLTAAARSGGLSAVTLTTTKAPSTVVQTWMSGTERERILGATDATVAYTGTVTEAIRRFPKSLNVAVALAHATGMWDEVAVTMVADPSAHLTTHRIVASGASGEYEFTIRNLPHPENPATSGVVPKAVLTAIGRVARPSGSFA